MKIIPFTCQEFSRSFKIVNAYENYVVYIPRLLQFIL